MSKPWLSKRSPHEYCKGMIFALWKTLPKTQCLSTNRQPTSPPDKLLRRNAKMLSILFPGDCGHSFIC